MLPSYQSSNFDKQSSSPVNSRSRSANRYSNIQEEEIAPSPDLIRQIDVEGDLERELNVLKLDVSVQSEYNHKTQEKIQSPGLKPLIQTSGASSIFKNDALQGSPKLSNRMREIQSQESSSAYSNSLKGILAAKKLSLSKLLPTSNQSSNRQESSRHSKPST